MNKFYDLVNRSEVPKYEKMKPKPECSHLVNYKKEREYEYYKCDYCGKEIRILEKKQDMTGGIVTIPPTLSKRGKIMLALCSKCLKPTLKIFEEV